MRLLSRFALAVLLVGLAAPAFASAIKPDPTIGVRGGGSASPLITDGSWYQFVACPTDLAGAGYQCQYYQFPAPEGIDVLAFQTADRNGVLFPDGSYALDDMGFTDPDYFLSQDANTAFFNYSPGPALIACFEGPCEFTFFFMPEAGLEGPFQVSLRGYQFLGGPFVTNDNLTPPGRIPEPGALMLLGTGLLTAGLRLRRRR
jgi:hypothetical protein